MTVNAILGFPRWTEGFAMSSGSWQTARPVSRVRLLPLSEAARSTDLADASCQIVATSTSIRPIGLVGLCGHTLTTLGWWRVEIFEDTALTALLYDSNWQYAEPAVNPSYTTGWYVPNRWVGRRPPEERDATNTSVMVLPQTYFGRAVRVSLHDPDNPAGYVDVGLLEIAEAWRVGVNFSYGSQFGLRFRDLLSEADKGGSYVYERPKARVFRGEIRGMDMDEVKAKAFEQQRQLGQGKPFLWVPNADDAKNLVRDAFLARQRDPGMFGHLSVGRGTAPINIEEVLG